MATSGRSGIFALAAGTALLAGTVQQAVAKEVMLMDPASAPRS